jgi:hypothetical protein
MGLEFAKITSGASGISSAMFFDSLWISARVPILDLNIPPIDPTRITHTQLKCPDTRFRFGIIFRDPKQYPNASQLSWLLRPCRKRPPSSRTAEQRDELAPLHSITSSARPSSESLPVPEAGPLSFAFVWARYAQAPARYSA